MLALFATIVVALTLAGGTVASAGALAKDQICDVTADSYLGLEDYNQAIKLHQRISAAHPQDALAHYHLGFAYGMVGQHDKELAEYRRAVELRLNHWDLYVNLGRVYLRMRKLSGGDRRLANCSCARTESSRGSLQSRPCLRTTQDAAASGT